MMHNISIKTAGRGDIIDVTDGVQQLIGKSDIKEGVVVVFVPGSTAGVTTIEYEKGLLEDFSQTMERMAPYGLDYKHHEAWHDDNGSSHMKASIIGPSITIPFTDGKLILGQWQQIVVMEFDTRPRERKLVVKMLED